MLNAQTHTYEEIRNAAVDILLRRVKVAHEPSQFADLQSGIAEVFAKAESRSTNAAVVYGHQYTLSRPDSELVREVFWDLFRQGVITLGMNDSNPRWPFFRLSHFGERALNSQSPYHFHDTGSFLKLVKNEIPDISAEAVVYLEEAVSALYAGCVLASCVMLGVAAEAEFLRLAEVAIRNAAHGTKFASVEKRSLIRQKITAFHDALKPVVSSFPHEATEDLETNFLAIQSVLRIARNEAGHPTGARPQREQVYVYLQLFVPFARQLMRLRRALS